MGILERFQNFKSQKRNLLIVSLLFYAFTVPLSKSISAIIMAFVAIVVVLGEMRGWKDVLLALSKDRIFLVLGVFTALYYLGLLNTEDMRRGFKICKNISIVLGTYIVLALTLRDAGEAERLLKALLGGIVVLILGAWGKFIGLYGGEAFKLPSSIVMNPIWFANVSAVGLYISVAFLSRPEGKGGYSPWGIAIVLSLTGLILSTSRGGWVATAIVSLVVLFPLSMKGKSSRIVLLLVLLGLFAYFWHPSNRHKVSVILSEAKAFFRQGVVDTSVGARLGMWTLCLGMWKDHPIFGAGTGDYIVEVRRRTEGKWEFLRRFNQPHSIYFHSLAMHGILGLLALIMVFAAVLKESVKEIKEGGARGRLGIVALAVTMHYMLAGLSETVLKIHVLVTIFGMVLGCAFGHRVGEK